MPFKIALFCGLAFCLSIMQGCVTMPKETAILNTMMGTQIAEAKRSNLLLIDDWARQRREKAETFLYYHWIPKFIIKFLNAPIVAKDMDKIVCEARGEMDRAIIIRDIVDAISKKVEEKRKEWYDLIENERRSLIDSVLLHYMDIERMHQAISANIHSVVKGSQFEKEIRETLAKPIKEIVPIDKANRKLEELLKNE